jgi:RNA polymerase sigma factor (TIGR02999 family)
MTDLTRVLSAIEQGDPHAAEQLLPLVYDELRKLAAQRLARESPGQTLQATALVHEAYLRLVDPNDARPWNGRRHFFGAAAEAMRRILVESARRKASVKHGGKLQRAEFPEAKLIGPAISDDLLALDEALSQLAQTDADQFHRARAIETAQFGPDHPDTLESMHSLAGAYADLGHDAEALELREETLARRRATLGPDHINTLQSMWGLAAELVALGRGAEAVPIIDECLRRAAAMSVQPNILGLANLRLQHFAKARDAAGCRATAELWEKMGRTDAASLYNAACYRAVTAAVIRATDKSPGAAREADDQADRAMTWLHQAIAAGYNNVDNMKHDTDLDSLRDREDFKALIRGLSTTAGKN